DDDLLLIATGEVLERACGGRRADVVVVIAKWLDTKPDLLIFDEPVQGVDVGARAEIFRLVHEAAAGGAGVLLISSETDEMLQLADRVLILRGGRLIQEVDPATTTAHEVTHLMHFDAEHDLGSEQELPR
ncbi:hypothetical protein ACWEWX_51120, partial [Streptomyces asiaticus]